MAATFFSAQHVVVFYYQFGECDYCTDHVEALVGSPPQDSQRFQFKFLTHFVNWQIETMIRCRQTLEFPVDLKDLIALK